MSVVQQDENLETEHDLSLVKKLACKHLMITVIKEGTQRASLWEGMGVRI